MPFFEVPTEVFAVSFHAVVASYHCINVCMLILGCIPSWSVMYQMIYLFSFVSVVLNVARSNITSVYLRGKEMDELKDYQFNHIFISKG
jgi:hypothetical protein